MAVFGKKGFAQRIAKAVDGSLDPGEQVEVSLWTRDPRGDLSRTVFGLLAEARVASFILTLTDRRVIMHSRHNFAARRSQMLGVVPTRAGLGAERRPAREAEASRTSLRG